MSRRAGLFTRLRVLARTPLARNLMARVGAMLALTAASILIAHTAGPSGLGTFTLLRLVPWLVGLLLSGGIYAAAPYFLTGSRRADSRYRSTLPAMAVASGVLGAAVWLASSSGLHRLLFPDLPLDLVALSAVTVATQLLETTAKACSQGFDDLPGSHRVMLLEELVFIPCYLVLREAHVGVLAAITIALPMGDVLNASGAWLRLARRGFFRHSGMPSVRHAREIVRYGARAVVGSVMTTLNARLDFALVAALVGPAALGVYAVASRYAELLRLPYLTLNYVLYPQYASTAAADATTRARRALPRAGWTSAVLALPMAAAAPAALPLIFGSEFHGATLPACILLLGLVGGGVNGVVSAYFAGVGRPGINSLAIGTGLVATVVLDVLLIPPFGISGAATASTACYLVTTAALTYAFRRVVARGEPPTNPVPIPTPVAEVAS